MAAPNLTLEAKGEVNAAPRGLSASTEDTTTTDQPGRDVDVRTGTYDAARDAQRSRFGGIPWGAAFLGWLTAVGLSVLLLTILTGTGVALALTEASVVGQSATQAAENSDTMGVIGGIALLVILFVAYLAGGYATGRMARLHGLRHGAAVWMIGVLAAALLAVAGVLIGNEYDVFAELNLPSIPVSGDSVATAGLVAGIAALVVSLLGALAGGRLGTHYRRKIDRAGVCPDRTSSSYGVSIVGRSRHPRGGGRTMHSRCRARWDSGRPV